MVSRPSIDQQITFLYTRDLARTAQFYERESAPEKPQGVLFTLVTQEVDAWYAYLHARGVPFDKPPAVNEAYGIYHCFARDPNGYAIEIQCFLDDAWNSG